MADDKFDDKVAEDEFSLDKVKEEKLDPGERTYADTSDHDKDVLLCDPISAESDVRSQASSPDPSSSSSDDEEALSPRSAILFHYSDSDTEPDPSSLPVDHASSCGSFGWAVIGNIHFPYLKRSGEGFVAVRMVESKIIGTYISILPWTVFACTNIRSYYVTASEANLLNEINSFHCEYFFGYGVYSEQDVVVSLEDTAWFYEFLESCRAKIQPESTNSYFRDRCGFITINCSPVPYVRKGTQKFILYNMIYQEGISASCTEIVSEWDLAYFRFLSLVMNIDQRFLKVGATLCAVDDLEGLDEAKTVEEWWPTAPFPCQTEKPDKTVSSHLILSGYDDDIQSVKSKTDKEEEYVEELNEIQKFNKTMEFDWSSSFKDSSTADEDGSKRSDLFPSSLESLLSSTSSERPNFSMDKEVLSNPLTGGQESRIRSRLSSLATSRPRPYPPPPPLVRIQQDSGFNIPLRQIPDNGDEHSQQPAPYSCSNPQMMSSGCMSWTPPDWMSKDSEQIKESVSNDPVATLDSESWTSVPTSCHVTTSGSFSYVQSNSSEKNTREGFDASNYTMFREDRHAGFHRGSPRSSTSTGTPHHYPTPPQSSPMPHVDFHPLSALADFFGAPPRSIIGLCSPPPSPDVRNAISVSPRGSSSDIPHSIRLAEIQCCYLLATNIEPFNFRSELVVPVSEVVNKFLKGKSVHSCQVTLESDFGLKLYDCTRLQQEAYAQHYVSVELGSKLVSVTDLKSCISKLKEDNEAEKKSKDEEEINLKSSSTNEDDPTDLVFKKWCEDGDI